MVDHNYQLKEWGWATISEIAKRYNLPLWPLDYIESPQLAMWRLYYYRGRISDIKKYEPEFKSLMGNQVMIESENGLISITTPKPKANKVMLYDVLESNFYKQCPGKLKIAVGEHSKGGYVVGDLNEWEHVLIAGSSGSGKTMFMHTIIHSLIHNNTPDDVKFVLFDFKGNEFAMYENMAYLNRPIVYRTKQAVKELKLLIDEMERRYQLLKDARCLDLESYNESNPKEPYLIVMIDEFARLTLKEKEAEEYLIELSQMARASGIYLILTVHRPNKDSIKPVIKTNISTRIAFQVRSYNESMAILDETGAEELLGNGDMILMDNDGIERVQGSYVSNEEIKTLGEKFRDDCMFVDDVYEIKSEEEADPLDIDEDYRNFYRAAKHCIEIGGANPKAVYDAVRVGERKQEEILRRMMREGIISNEKGYYGRYKIMMTLEEFLKKYEEA